jgi:dTMP kinase
VRGRLVVFEGVDHTGKTTQIHGAESWLKGRGIAFERHREPGGTPVGERVREILLDRKLGRIDPVAEAMLFFASRAQLAHDSVAPAIEAGRTVLLDRYYFSTAAYQGPWLPGGPDFAVDMAARMGLPQPDLVVGLDGDPRALAARATGEPDRIEAKGIEYQNAVRLAYAGLAKRWPRWFRIVDAERPPEDVRQEVAGLLGDLFTAEAGAA